MTQKIALAMCYRLGKSYSKYESHSGKFVTARTKFTAGCDRVRGIQKKKKKKMKKEKKKRRTKPYDIAPKCGMANHITVQSSSFQLFSQFIPFFKQFLAFQAKFSILSFQNTQKLWIISVSAQCAGDCRNALSWKTPPEFSRML